MFSVWDPEQPSQTPADAVLTSEFSIKVYSLSFYRSQNFPKFPQRKWGHFFLARIVVRKKWYMSSVSTSSFTSWWKKWRQRRPHGTSRTSKCQAKVRLSGYLLPLQKNNNKECTLLGWPPRCDDVCEIRFGLVCRKYEYLLQPTPMWTKPSAWRECKREGDVW